MKLMDCVEVAVEKKEYAKEGVHKGMQGVIWEPECKDGCWMVLIPQYGEKEDIQLGVFLFWYVWEWSRKGGTSEHTGVKNVRWTFFSPWETP